MRWRNNRRKPASLLLPKEAAGFFALSLLAVCSLSATSRSQELKSIGIFAQKTDHAKSMKAAIESDPALASVTIYDSFEAATVGADELLVLSIQRLPQKLPDVAVDTLKQRKVIGFGYGVAAMFGQIGLDINGGACAHFGSTPDIQLEKSLLLGMPKSTTPFDQLTRGGSSWDTFGMHIPVKSELRSHVDVIARFAQRSNYAPVVRQKEYVMIGVSSDAGSWSVKFRQLFRQTAAALLAREKKPFATTQFVVQPPGELKFDLGKFGTADELTSRTFYFKFDKPTKLTAELQHEGSDAMMLMFSGQKNQIGWQRVDARQGEALRISAHISTSQIRQLGDRYWTLNVTNFDREHRAKCRLKIQHEEK